MSKNVALGLNVYDTLSVGDTLVNAAGEPFESSAYVALNHRTLILKDSGEIFLQGKNPIDDTTMSQAFSVEEVDAIRGFLNVIELRKKTEKRAQD